MPIAAAASNRTITEKGAPTAKLPLANSFGRYLNRNWKRLSTVLPLQATSYEASTTRTPSGLRHDNSVDGSFEPPALHFPNMKAHYLTADVFTDRRFGGNQLAVFPDARQIASDLMPQIAREFNYSETTFVLPPADPSHTAKVRIFTPGGELQFAGHPTIGTAHILATIGAIAITGGETRIVFEEGVGPIPVTIHSTNGKPTSAQLSVAKLPEFGPPPPSHEVLAAMLSLSKDDVLHGDLSAQAVSCGTPFLFIPLRDRAAVARSRVKLDLFESALGSYITDKVMVFALDGELPGSDVRARMFAPGLGIPEDP